MSKKWKIVIAAALFAGVGSPLVYYILAWTNHDPLRFGFAQRHNRESFIAVSNRSSFPVRFQSCYISPGAPRSGYSFFSFHNNQSQRDIQFLRPGETRTLTPTHGDISVLENFGPLTITYTWQPPGHQTFLDACGWIRGHLPSALKDKFPEPRYHRDSYESPLTVEILKPTKPQQ